MVVAEALVNVDGSISAIAAAFFSALFAFLTYLSREMFKTRRELRNAKRVADATKRNTDPISGDFAGNLSNDMRVLLNHQRSIDNAFHELGQQLHNHLAWHVSNPQKGTHHVKQPELDRRPYPGRQDDNGQGTARIYRRDVGRHSQDNRDARDQRWE